MKLIKYINKYLLINYLMNDLDEITCKVGIALRSLRIEAGYKSYEQFAFEYGISRIQYWKMESGNNFTLKSLLTVLDTHELSLEKFLLSLKDQKSKHHQVYV